MTGKHVHQAVTGARHPMRRLRILLLVVLALGFFSPCAVAEDEAEEAKDYRSGSIRLGAFWVGQIDNTIVARSESFPVGLFIDLSRDFALSDSITVPRGMFGYRFSRRHQVNFGYFQISRDNQVVLERTIENAIADAEGPNQAVYASTEIMLPDPDIVAGMLTDDSESAYGSPALAAGVLAKSGDTLYLAGIDYLEIGKFSTGKSHVKLILLKLFSYLLLRGKDFAKAIPTDETTHRAIPINLEFCRAILEPNKSNLLRLLTEPMVRSKPSGAGMPTSSWSPPVR